MKKIISLILCFCFMVTLVACTQDQPIEDTMPTEPTEANEIFYKNEYIAIRDYSKPIFDFYQFEVTEDDLQLYVNYYILLPNATYTNVYEGVVEEEDYLNISVKTTDKDGNVVEEYTTGTGGYYLYVGLNDYLEGIDAAVLGANVGETKSFETTIEDVAVTVAVTINYIQETELPEATDELAQEAGYESLEAFKEEYRVMLEEEYNADAYKVFLESIKEELIVEVYDYPEGFIDSYEEQYRESAEFFAVLYSLSFEDYITNYCNMTVEEWEAQIKDSAKKDAETELLLLAVLESTGVEFDDEAYEYYLDIMAESTGYANGDALKIAMQEQGVEDNLKRECKMHYAYDIFFIVGKVRVIDYATGEILVDFAETTETE